MDLELNRRVKSRMLEYTKIGSPMEIRATRDNRSHCIAQVIILGVVRGTDDMLRYVQFPIVFVPGSRRNIFGSLTAAQLLKQMKSLGHLSTLEPLVFS